MNKLLSIFLLVLAFSTWGIASNQSATSQSQFPSPPVSPGNDQASRTSSEPSQPPNRGEIEWQKLDIEKQKLDVEKQKLDIERVKARWSAISTIVPLLGALGTIIYSVWSFRRAAVQTAALQKQAAELQFEMKAAEIAFSGKTPEAVSNRAKVLKRIFGNRLPDNFPPTFEPEQYGGGKESPEEKMFFLELLLKYPGKEAKITELWKDLFRDKWLNRVRTTPEPIVAPKKSESSEGDTVTNKDAGLLSKENPPAEEISGQKP